METTAVASLNDSLPVVSKALVVGCHSLPQHFTNRLRQAGRFEEIERNPEEQGSCTRHPEGICPLHLCIEHRCNPLDVVDTEAALRCDVGVWVPARGPPILSQRIEQIAFLADRKSV